MKALNPSTGNLETVYVKALDSNIVGTILPYAGTTLPTGYMFCDGSAVSRTTYSDLFSAIGTTYGSGDGSTTFNLPNLKGRTVVMQDTTQTEFDTLGETDGSKTDDLSNAYAKVGRSSADYSALQYTAKSGSGTFNRKQSQSLGFGGSSDVIADATELGGSVSRLQPYIVLNYIIKVAETRALAGTILNAQNSSTTDTYSCDYINEAFGGVVLWENSSPASVFAGQSVTLSSGNYNYFEIYFRAFTGQDKIKSIRFQKGQNGLIDCMFKFGNDVFAGLRNFDYTDATHITFGNGEKVIQNNAISTGTDNGWIIPVKIIGYK